MQVFPANWTPVTLGDLYLISKLPNKAPEDVFKTPLAPTILDPLGNGSKRAFFLAEAPVPDGPADCSSS